MRIQNIYIVVLVSALFALSSCKKNGATFTMQLKAKYGNQSFRLNSTYIDPAGRYVNMGTLKFYLSHINLIKSNGSQVKVMDIAIFDFSDTTALSVSVPNIDGSFTGISFACGLDSVTNTSDPLNYSVPNPLAGDYNMYWSMLKYQFEVLEGKWDTQDSAFLRNPLVYHIGTNTAYRQTQLNKSFSISSSNYNMVVYLDVEQIFNNTTTGETLDLVTESSTMSSSSDNPAVLPKFVDNFSKAFTF